jgi:hypothetical protein
MTREPPTRALWGEGSRRRSPKSTTTTTRRPEAGVAARAAAQRPDPDRGDDDDDDDPGPIIFSFFLFSMLWCLLTKDWWTPCSSRGAAPSDESGVSLGPPPSGAEESSSRGRWRWFRSGRILLPHKRAVAAMVTATR